MKKICIILALFTLCLGAMNAQSTYVITGSGDSFTALKEGSGNIITNKPIQEVIDKIRDNAFGADCTIKFGTGGGTLDIGNKNITFENGTTGIGWGLVTLEGNLTSKFYYNLVEFGVLVLKNSVSINSKANITFSNNMGIIIFHNSTGTLTISDGKISVVNCDAGTVIINRNTGMVKISGGEISVPAGVIDAIENYSTGTIVIDGGTVTSKFGYAIINRVGTVTISGGKVLGTIVNFSFSKITVSGTALISGLIVVLSDATLEMTGGTVENTGIYQFDNAILISERGSMNISGGKVSADLEAAIVNKGTGKITVSGTAHITSATKDNNATILIEAAGTETICRLEITGGTVECTSPSGLAIRNNSTSAMNITGGVISSAHRALGNYSTAALTITGGTISSPKTCVHHFNPSAGPLTITGGTFYATDDYAVLSSGTTSITGGLFSSTGNGAVCQSSAGTISIIGGIFRATTNYAFYSTLGTVDIKGGIFFAYGKTKDDVIYGGFPLTGNATVIAWNDEGSGVYNANTSVDIFKDPTSATAVWAKQAGEGGIYVENGTNKGFVPVEGVTVKGKICTVTFAGESVSIPPQTLEEGDLVARPTDPERTGYDFKGWFTDNNTFANEWDFDNDFVTGDMALYAKWELQDGIENYAGSAVHVYPNPTTGKLRITNYELRIEGIEIFDIYGRKISSHHLITTSSNQIDISHLPEGVYFVKIQTEAGEVVKKVVKE